VPVLDENEQIKVVADPPPEPEKAKPRHEPKKPVRKGSVGSRR
jgi:hypothetical protein